MTGIEFTHVFSLHKLPASGGWLFLMIRHRHFTHDLRPETLRGATQSHEGFIAFLTAGLKSFPGSKQVRPFVLVKAFLSDAGIQLCKEVVGSASLLAWPPVGLAVFFREHLHCFLDAGLSGFGTFRFGDPFQVLALVRGR